jgi:uncharacterized protein YPO0396
VRIAEGARVNIAQLPFAGELMDVRPECQSEWRGAMEKLLRGFGLSILVPSSIYSPVNRYINANNMRGKVVYHPIPETLQTDSRGYDKGRVIEKMVFKQNHVLTPWVESEVRSQFNHRCCESVEEFEGSSGYAITKQGLIRGGRSRHIKDDIHDIRDPRNYILGWSNREKIRMFEQVERELDKRRAELDDVKTSAEKRQKNATRISTMLGNIARFVRFSDIDWRSSSNRIEALRARKQELERSSDLVRELRRQLDIVTTDIENTEGDRSALLKSAGGLQKDKDNSERRLQLCRETLERYAGQDITAFGASMDELMEGYCLKLDNAAAVQQAASDRLGKQILEISNQRGELVKAISKAMQQFLNEYQEMQADLKAEREFMPEFLNLRAAIENDDLPRHEDRFRELMSRDVLAHVASFQDALESHCEEMKTNISHLNDTLRGIPYNPGTYIAIRPAQTADNDIRVFRGKLTGCLEFGLSDDAASRENAFARISELIHLLREKPDWAAKVTDTRLWLSFGIEEVCASDGSQAGYSTDSDGRSGGQKAKFAFTILASALAYQYRIAGQSSNPKSFRFVVVDEMFARTDEKHSRYALDLFATFQLQLLIVSPFDARARVVEPYVSSYHLTINPTSQSSKIRTITSADVAERLERQRVKTKAHVESGANS